ncbi:ECF RNA polymerase sigma factor SigD [Phycisphaerae bacterium RAS1]|nr:ECF RNA polymerase sigma factor SigD [Phycisphaerae bacterium RAS1]
MTPDPQSNQTPAAPPGELTARAVAGDDAALTELLFKHFDPLLRYVDRKLPSDLRGVVAADDVVQETFIEVFRSIQRFRPEGGEVAFYRWMVTIADQRMLDKIKAQRRLKRGGGRNRIDTAWLGLSSSFGPLVNVLRQDDHTPSRVAARGEWSLALGEQLAALKDEYRDALKLRYVEGLSVAEIAKKMGRTERAVHMLCYRGIRQLRDLLGDPGRYLSRDG